MLADVCDCTVVISASANLLRMTANSGEAINSRAGCSTALAEISKGHATCVGQEIIETCDCTTRIRLEPVCEYLFTAARDSYCQDSLLTCDGVEPRVVSELYQYRLTS